MKKIISMVIVLAVVFLGCLPIAAHDGCAHELTVTVPDSIDTYMLTIGCTLIERTSWSGICIDCGVSFEEYDDTVIATEHIEEYATEWCDGYMHHTYYSCACGEISHTESDWCSDPDNCPAVGRR